MQTTNVYHNLMAEYTFSDTLNVTNKSQLALLRILGLKQFFCQKIPKRLN